MKSTWPTPAPRVGDPMPPIFYLLTLGLALGVTQILAFLGTNMLVSPMQNCGIGGLSQREDPTQWNIGFTFKGSEMSVTFPVSSSYIFTSLIKGAVSLLQ